MYVEPARSQYLYHDQQLTVLTTRLNTRILNLSTSHTWRLHGNNQGRNTPNPLSSRPNSRSAVIGKDAIGNPLLRPIHNINISFALSRRCNSRNIRSSYRNIVRTILTSQQRFTANSPSGSVTPKQNLFFPVNISGKNRLLCSSFPKLMTGGPPIEFPQPNAQTIPRYPQRASSSMTIRSWNPSHSRGSISPGSRWPWR